MDLLKKGIQATDPVPGDVEKWPRVHNLSFQHVRVENVADLLDGVNIPPARPVDGLTLADISGTCARAISIANMTNVNFSALHVTGFTGPLIQQENVTGTGLDASATK